MSDETNIQEGIGTVYFNKPQLLSLITDANQEYDVWGRGTGKTSGVLAPRIRRNLINLPRAKGIFIGETYQQMLTRTLPSLINGLEKLGFVRDVHYQIGKRPPKTWALPFEPPVKWDYFIAARNGSGCHLVSQDIAGSSNGINSDWIAGDEVKYLNHQRYLEEVLPTLRANRTRYGHLYYHHSICFTTSMPTVADAKWILEKEKEMDREQILIIQAMMGEVIKLQQQLINGPKSYHPGIKRKIRKLLDQLNLLRKDAVYFSEASTLDNIHVLGETVIRNLKRAMPDFLFRTEVLNERPLVVENSFYPYLDHRLHTYSNYNQGYLESMNYDFEKVQNIDCRQDADIVQDLPLYIAIDWGARINCMSTGQFIQENNEVRFLSGFYVKHPEYLDHLARKWGEYYRYKVNKEVYMAYDHTGHNRQANSDLTYAQQFQKILVEEFGWVVYDVGRRTPLLHKEKYLLWMRILKEEDELPIVRFNKSNCWELLVSMGNAPVKEGYKGIQKDKTSESNDSLPQEEATHFSDTADILLDAMVGNVFNEYPDYVGIITSK